MFLEFFPPLSGVIEGILYGPMHSEVAVQKFEQAVREVKAEGGTVAYGGKVRYQ